MNILQRIFSTLLISSLLISCNASTKQESTSDVTAGTETTEATPTSTTSNQPPAVAETVSSATGSSSITNSAKVTSTNQAVVASNKATSTAGTSKSLTASAKPATQNSGTAASIQSGNISKGLQNTTVKTTNTTGKGPQTPQLPGNISGTPTKTTTTPPPTSTGGTTTNTGSTGSGRARPSSTPTTETTPPTEQTLPNTTNTNTNTGKGRGGSSTSGTTTTNNTGGNTNTGGGVGDVLGDILGGGAGNFTEGEAAKAIKEALMKGISAGVDKVSVTNGYFGNNFIKIPFPKDAQVVETTLRQVGMGSMIDNMVLASNRAAESAAKQALPIFVNSITQMTISDAINIVSNKQSDAATQFLQRTTTEPLVSAFKPSIKSALDKTLATKYWADIMGYYNKIPFVQKINTDLTDFVTRKAVSGLFYMVAQEEAKIRKDPGARTSDILKKVFGNVKF